MSLSKPLPMDVLTFAAGWIARNIEVGPFSWNDLPIDDRPIRLFKTEAAQAGFSDGDVERGIGPVPEFIARAYVEAVANWCAAQNP